jgi:hypothetical protein
MSCKCQANNSVPEPFSVYVQYPSTIGATRILLLRGSTFFFIDITLVNYSYFLICIRTYFVKDGT